MIRRNVSTPEKHSFFLFGGRGTGKSTLVRKRYPNAHIIDLLDPRVEAEYAIKPDRLVGTVEALENETTHVIIDEIQKVPKLLDVVHYLIESRQSEKHFILTGSSARKLKAGGANLLAGRAFLRNLLPLTYDELGPLFNEVDAMSFGTLPKVFSYETQSDKADYLDSYCQSYLKEEVWGEQIIRNLVPFRRFLEIAAIDAGKILNCANVSRDVGVDPKTIQSYYSILEDTLLGCHLDPFHRSVRKRQRSSPKFYFFDNGVVRSLAGMTNVVPKEGTSYFGDLFEALVFNEIYRKNAYGKFNFRFSYLQSAAAVEVDLVVERPGQNLALVEMKSASRVNESMLSGLRNFERDFPEADLFLFSRDPVAQKFDRVAAVHWRAGIEELFKKGSR